MHLSQHPGVPRRCWSVSFSHLGSGVLCDAGLSREGGGISGITSVPFSSIVMFGGLFGSVADFEGEDSTSCCCAYVIGGALTRTNAGTKILHGRHGMVNFL